MRFFSKPDKEQLMYWLIGLMTFGILAIIAAGFYYDKLPDRGVQQARWFKPAMPR